MAISRREFKTLSVTFLAFMTYHYNRKSVSLIIPHLKNDGLTQQNAGTILSTHSLAMAILAFFVGVFSDGLSSRALLSFGLLLSGVSTLLFAYSSNVYVFIVLWFANGIGQGFSLPLTLRITKQNSPTTQFATFWSLMLTAVNISGVINPLLSAYLTQSFGWRFTLTVSAVITTSVAILSYLLIEETATQLPINKQKSEPRGKYVDVLRYPMLWMAIVCRAIVALSRQGVTDWGPLYLIEERQATIYTASTYISVFEVGGVLGKLLTGSILDYLLRSALRSETNQSEARVGLRLPVSISLMILNATALHMFCFAIDGHSSDVLLMTNALLMGASAAGLIVTFSVISTEISSKQLSGLCSSLVDLSTKGGAIIAGLPMSAFAYTYSWSFTYFTIELLCIFGVILQILVPKLSKKSKFD